MNAFLDIQFVNSIISQFISRPLLDDELWVLNNLTDGLPFKKKASVVKKFLTSKGYDIGLGQCQEFIARMSGFSNYGELRRNKTAFEMGDVKLKDVNLAASRHPMVRQLFELNSWSNDPYPLLPANLSAKFRSCLSEEHGLCDSDSGDKGCTFSVVIVLLMFSKIQRTTSVEISDEELEAAVSSLCIENSLVELLEKGLLETFEVATTYEELVSSERQLVLRFPNIPEFDAASGEQRQQFVEELKSMLDNLVLTDKIKKSVLEKINQ